MIAKRQVPALLAAVLLTLLLVAACANPEPEEAYGTPEAGESTAEIAESEPVTGTLPETDPDSGKLTESEPPPGSLPDTGGGDTMELPPEVTATVSATVGTTDSLPGASGTEGAFPVITGTVTGTTATVPDDALSIQVKLDEYSIEMVDTIPAGPVIFGITNAGNWEHGFVIEGDGIRAALDRPLQLDEVGEIRLVLPAGTYQVFCPVDGYADMGMSLELTVTP